MSLLVNSAWRIMKKSHVAEWPHGSFFVVCKKMVRAMRFCVGAWLSEIGRLVWCGWWGHQPTGSNLGCWLRVGW